MTIVSDIQKPSISSKVELFTISNFDKITPTNVFRFCNLGKITWRNDFYNAIPCQSSGFTLTGQSLPRPRLKVTNIHGLLSNVVEQYNSFIGAKLTRTVTLEKYLDALPTNNPLEEFETSIWTIEQKLADNETELEWELSFAGLEGLKLPRRTFLNNYCDAAYRSARCGYVGIPVAKIDDTPTTDPALDRCGKRVKSCKLRNNTLNYAGVPGARFT
jgi:lambda family phage minor tail protein L